MPTLYSYCIPFDDGAAPNPFWGLCTLAICKPIIRRNANVGDWVVGTGSVNSPIGDISGKVVHAMRVTQKMTMEEYDHFTRAKLPYKIPSLKSKDTRRIVGDSIYDFSKPTPALRPGVHGEENIRTDLSGMDVLISDHFYYFGNQPIHLPATLQGIVKQGQGHKSTSNAPYFNDFVDWIESLEYKPATLIGEPQWWSKWNIYDHPSACAKGRKQEAETELSETNF